MKAVSVWRALPRGVRSFFGVACYLLSHLLLDTIAQNFTVGAGISVWYLPAALTLVLLFVFGLQNLPVVFAAVVLAQLVNDTSQPLLSTLVHALTYSLVYGGAALLLRRLGVDPQLRRLRDVGWLMFLGAAAAPLVASLTSVTNFAPVRSVGPSGRYLYFSTPLGTPQALGHLLLLYWSCCATPLYQARAYPRSTQTCTSTRKQPSGVGLTSKRRGGFFFLPVLSL